MRRARAGDPVDLRLDGEPWTFDTWPDAANTRRKLAGYKGAEWPAWAETTARLKPEYEALQAQLAAGTRPRRQSRPPRAAR